MKNKSTLLIKSSLYPYRVFFNQKIKKFKNNKSFFLVDKYIFKKYKLKKKLPKGKYLTIDSKEKNKSFENLDKIFNFLLSNNIDKKSVIIAIGGGILQDISGFVSSAVLRGVEWRFYPTTILSQCDSCIGGKTSINFKGTKNKIGNFYPPKEIYIDMSFIKTLKEKELRSGIGEMAHYFFVKDQRAFNFFKANYNKGIDKNLSTLKKLIYNSLLIKKNFIEKDEFDQGPRLILNYGHSFGHAIEKITNYKLPHGIAVAHGMDIANFISWKKQFISHKTFNALNDILRDIWKNYKIKSINLENFLSAIKKDKKNINKKIRVILTKGIGKMFIYQFKENKNLKLFLRQYCSHNNIKF